ncbi:hypothetical protein JCM16814_04670 [Desulfobaculum senezii]
MPSETPKIEKVFYKELQAYLGKKTDFTFNSLLHDTLFAFVAKDKGYWGKDVEKKFLHPTVTVPAGLMDRREALVAQWRKRARCRALSFEATTTSRFVTGMGLPHPKENGFSWMRPYGVPYIPGSSLKGMLRAWLESDWCDWGCHRDTRDSDETKDPKAEEKERCSRLKKLFGTAGQMGEIVFMDVIPSGNKVQLAMDVMTPHYGPYYGASDGDLPNNPPADWYDPVPIQFLTVEAGQKFRIDLLLPQEKAVDGDIGEKLREGLELYGIGAKTSSGFGRFALEEIEGKKSE